MAVQLAPDMEYNLDGLLAHAQFVLSAAEYIRQCDEGLSEESMEELADLQVRMAMLLAWFEDGPAFGAIDDTMLYAMRGYEAHAAELLQGRLS